MKILVVSGFLGAGKTTFIEGLTKNVDKDFVILENEYGEVGIDGELLKKEDINVWEMTEGCICCSMKANFATSILTIYNSLAPEVLIVEPTGVGLLSSVMKNIKKIQYDRIEVLEPITIVDPLCVDHYIDEFKDIFTDQIINSRKIIISKTSNLEKERILYVENKIKEINPDAEIFSQEYSKYDTSWWEGILGKTWDRNNEIKSLSNDVTSNIENIGFSDIEFKDLQRFEEYMSAIMRGNFGKIVRAKGFLPINNQWAKFDIVDKTYTLEKIEPMKESKIILIGTNLKKDELKILFTSEI